MTSERRARPAGDTGRSRGSSRYLCAAFACLLAGSVSLVPGCGGPKTDTPIGSNTNWLTACDETAACTGEAACVCGACSLECRADADCGRISGARCVLVAEPAARSQCRSDTPSLALGICLESCQPGSCPLEQSCVDGACVVSEPLGAELCAGLPAPDAAERTRQDGLLELIAGLRSAGGVDCGGPEPSAGVAPLRWDARLACAARALAGDMAATRRQSLVDSGGRDTVTRLGLAGYTPRVWAESFALVPGDEQAALTTMLRDQGSCLSLVSAGFTQIGVGNEDDAYVVTIGSE
ncbi:MAG TPA: CAP domain-containing protein [Polyangiaceae bacterium]